MINNQNTKGSSDLLGAQTVSSGDKSQYNIVRSVMIITTIIMIANIERICIIKSI